MLPVVGLALFVLVRTYLNGFYGRLGVDPDEVGLGYAETLGSSIGLLVFVALAVVVGPATVIAGAYAALRVGRSAEPLRVRDLPSAIGHDTLAIVRRALPFGTAASVLLFAVLFSGKAAHYAHAVERGHPIRFGALPLTSFKVRASPMRLEPVGAPSDNPGLADLAQRSKRSPPLAVSRRVEREPGGLRQCDPAGDPDPGRRRRASREQLRDSLGGRSSLPDGDPLSPPTIRGRCSTAHV
jgi:hypothetical protein